MRRFGPRQGLGPGRADPEWARFDTTAEVLRYLCDYHGWTHAQLAERCGVRREQITRWMNRTAEPTLGRLTELLEALGWSPQLGLLRTDDVLAGLQAAASPTVLEYPVQSIVWLAADAADQGLDVVVGGEVAAVLQGVQVPTRQLVLHIRPAHREPFTVLARENWLGIETHPDQRRCLRSGPVLAEIRPAPVLPASRMVPLDDERQVAVVDLEHLVDDPTALAGSVRAAAGRLIGRAG